MTFNVGETIFGHYYQNKKLREITGENKVFFGQFATPYPGSRFAETANDDGIVLVEKWQDYVTTNVNFVPRGLLDERPIRNLKRLRMTDSMKIIRELGRIEDFSLVDMKVIIDTLKKIRFFYQNCNGKNSLEEICGKMLQRFDIGYKDSLSSTMKIAVILSQLGLIKPDDMVQYPEKILPDWQKRFYGIDSNLNMNIYLLFDFFSIITKNITKRITPPKHA
jgi:hypothetical protein